jgi:hypothetical protein
MPVAVSRTPGRRAVSGAVAVTKSRPPPIKGWNTVLSMDGMKPEWAVTLDNWFPQPGYIEPRGGRASHCATGNAADVESLMAYQGLAALDDKLFAAAGTVLYDATTSVPSSSLTGLANSRFQHINFTTTGGKFLYIVNGADTRHFDGTAWATPAITGIVTADIVHINIHKNRIWFTMKNSTKAAYLPVDSIQGAAVTLELGAVFPNGGYLMAMGTWSRDTGTGPDDFAVFISSEGDLAVYAGTDPSDATKWKIVNVYEVGPPMGRRCFTKIGSDLGIITIDGVLPMSQIPGIERGAAGRISLTANIQPSMNTVARAGKDLFGWQLLSYPRGTMAILNVPLTTGDTQQFVMNTVTGGWARFLDQHAHCWETYKDRLFFGGHAGVVYEADKGSNDAGAAIVATMKTAFDYMDERGRQKQWTLLRPKLTTEAQLTPTVGLNVDFRDDAQPSPSLSALTGVALWDVALWDVDVWPAEQFFRNEWITVTGVGYCASVVMSISIDGPDGTKPLLHVNGFDFIFQPGGPM